MQNERLKTLRKNQPIGVKAAEVLRRKLLRKTSLTMTSDDDDGSLLGEGDESADMDWYETNKHIVEVSFVELYLNQKLPMNCSNELFP